MKILILGASGMLGNSVARVFRNDTNYQVAITTRPNFDLSNLDFSYNRDFRFDCTQICTRIGDLNKFLDERDYEPDYVINCIGVIKPFIDKDISHSIFINSYFPHYLCGEFGSRGIKVIHISTDCVFSGKTGNYTERDEADDSSLYGKSKSLGEPQGCMMLRASIIGSEIHKDASLVAWMKTQKHKEAFGYTNHLWNGITTTEYGNICKKIIDNNLYEKGTSHVHSPRIVSKYELLGMINHRFNLGVTISPKEAPDAINRSLATVKNLNEKLQISTLEEQVSDMP